MVLGSAALGIAVPQQIELIAPQYSWDTGTFASSSKSSASSAAVNYVHDSDEEGSAILGDEADEQEERLAAHYVESILARVRTVGYSLAAPDSVSKAVRRLGKRKSMTPPSNISRKSAKGMNKRAQSVLRSYGPAPASIIAAEQMLNQRRDVGPQAQIKAPGNIDASVSIGTAAAGGVHWRNEAPLQEPFSVFMPPPFRTIFLVALGLFCWSANLRGLRRLGLDADGLMSPDAKLKFLPHHRPPSSSSSAPTPRHVGPGDSELAVYFRQAGPQETASFYLGLLCFIWASVCWISYRLYAFQTIFYGGDQIRGIANARGRHAQALQSIAVFGVCVVTIWPGDVLYRSMRKAFGKQLWIVCLPILTQKIEFSHVLFADILTSFARVFGDLWLVMCFLWPKSDTPAWWNGKGSIAVPILVSLPYAIRLRQCLSEYNISQPTPGKHDRSMKPIYNALKYASAFPVIWLSVVQGRNIAKSHEETVAETSMWFYLWIISVFVNSIFSFWWDVTNDWGLEMLKLSTWTTKTSMIAQGVRTLHRKSSSIYVGGGNGTHAKSEMTPRDGAAATVVANGNGHTHPRPHQYQQKLAVPSVNLHSGSIAPSSSSSSSSGHSRTSSAFLRGPEQVMLFPPIVYQLAITCDLILRFAWSLKLSSHLSHIIELESTAFYLEAMEILRRCFWVFLRVEWEACKRRSWEAEGSMESITLSTLRSDPQIHRED